MNEPVGIGTGPTILRGQARPVWHTNKGCPHTRIPVLAYLGGICLT